MTDHDEFDELEIEVRSAPDIAARLVILGAVVRRAMLDLPSTDPSDTETANADRFDLAAALRDEPLAAHVTDEELQSVAAPVGSLNEEEALSASWRVEAIAALLALTQPGFPLSEPWVQADARALLAAIPEPWDDLRAFADSIEPPTDDTAAVERERAELWAWRSAVEPDLETATGRDLTELLQTIAETANEAAAAGLLRAAKRDFRVDARPFRELDPETKAVVAAIATQRLHALNWLCGFGDSWDSVPLDI